MNKKGFTLIELLAVIVLLALIAVIAVPSILGIKNTMEDSTLNAKLSIVETAAIKYGKDHKSDLINSDYINNGNDRVIEIQINDLVPNYMDSDVEYNDNNGCLNQEGCVINPNDSNSFIDDYYVHIIYRNNKIFAKVINNEDINLEENKLTERIIYTIHFNTNGGNEIKDKTVLINDDFKVDTPTKQEIISIVNNLGAELSSEQAIKNYTFNGWTATNLNISTAKHGSNNNPTTSWTNGETPVNEAYFKGLGSKNSTVTLTANWGNYSAELPEVRKDGYSCGYTTSSTNSSIEYDSGETYDGNSNNLYVHCSGNQFTLTYNNQSGSGCSSKTGTYGSTWGTLCTPERTGYTFNGWYTNTLGGSEVTSSSTVSGNQTVYAIWTENLFTLQEIIEGLSTGGIKTNTSGEWAVVNEDGYRYEGKNPDNYLIMCPSTNLSCSCTPTEITNNTCEYAWRIIGMFPDGTDGSNVIRIVKNKWETQRYNNDTSTNHWPNSTLYSSWSSIYTIGEGNKYPKSIQFNVYLGTYGSFSSYTSADLYKMERGVVEGTKTYGGAGPKNTSGSVTLPANVGLIYPSDYGYGVLAKDCERTKEPYNYDGSESCYNNNWLFQGRSKYQWLMSPNASYTYYSFGVAASGYGNVGSNVTNSYAARPVLSLKSSQKVMGSGTPGDPYELN